MMKFSVPLTLGRFALGSLVGLALPIMAGASAQAAEPTTAALPRQIVIGLDLSKSNPLVSDKGYAARVAERLKGELADLPIRSRVIVRTFGVYNATSNHLKIDQVISGRARPEDVAEGISKLVANLPALVAQGKLKAQMKTNIVPFLETMSHVIDCSAMTTKVILLTDGAEDSEYGKLTRRGGSLPMPGTALYEGCEQLQVLGIGQGFNSPKTTARFQVAWKNWSQGAGFENFLGLYDW